MKYEALIFDVGDTLVKHSPGEEEIYISRIEYLGFMVDDVTAKSIANAITKTAHEQIQKEQNGSPRMPDNDFTAMLDKAALSCINKEKNEDELLRQLNNISLPKQELTIIPGTVDVLQSLKDKGFRLGIVSNHRAWLPEFLKEIGLTPFFETIVVSDIVGVEKPDTRIMKIALDNMKLKASSCLYIGDHPFDVLCAKNAGIDCAWLTEPDNVLPESIPYKEDYKIKKLDELIKYII